MRHIGWAFVRRNMERHEGGHASSRDGSDTRDGRWLRTEALLRAMGLVCVCERERKTC
jgi:hypothetical protein